MRGERIEGLLYQTVSVLTIWLLTVYCKVKMKQHNNLFDMKYIIWNLLEPQAGMSSQSTHTVPH